jgi:hypothetical protein
MTSETQMLPRPCGATMPSLRDPGWECTGRALIIVAMTKATGGDHLHLCMPRRPSPERS